jgi:hypothetical protein
MSTWVGLLALMAYAASLGGLCVMVWHHNRSVWRCLPVVLTLSYYVLLMLAPAPVSQAVTAGRAYAWGDALRNSASGLALLSALWLLHRALKGRPA